MMNQQEAIEFCLSYFTETGSRFFHRKAPEIVPVTKDTDYDFVAYVGMPFLDEFEKLPGVKRVILCPEYVDSSYVAYWLMYDEPTSFFSGSLDVTQKKPQIQVIVRPSYLVYSVYRDIFDNITPEFYRNFLWKSAPGMEKPKQKVAERMNLLMEYQLAQREVSVRDL
jgi:hypothetical protein